MKTIQTQLLYLLLALPLLFWSCSDDDNDLLAPPSASFAMTVDPDNPYKFFFENTTPGSSDYYSYWQFTDGGSRVVDGEGAEENEYSDGGNYVITLTVVGQGIVSQATRTISLENKPEQPTMPTEPDNSGNLLLNGNLEEGQGDEFTNWAKFNGADRMTQETEDVFKGIRAMKVVNPSEGDQYLTQFVSDAVPTEVGAFYTASVWIKGGPGTIRFSTNASNGDNAQYGGDTEVTEDWSQIVYTFSANTDETEIVLDMGASAATYIVDDIQLVAGSEPAPAPGTQEPAGPESIVMNGGLEEGDNNEFTNWSKFNGADRMTQETEDVYEGSRAMKVVNPEGGDQYLTQLASDAVPTEMGTDYTASLWIKGGPGTIRFSTNASNGDNAQYGGDTEVTEDWSQITYTFTANTDETELVLDMGASAATYIVDKIELIKVEE